MSTTTTTTTNSNVRIVGFIKRRPGLTEQQFYEHWEKVHGPLVTPWAVKHGFVAYSQLHTTSELRTQWSALLGPEQDYFDFNGVGFMEMETIEQFLTACQDPYSLEVISKDESNFLDETKTKTTVGLSKAFVVDGKAVAATSR